MTKKFLSLRTIARKREDAELIEALDLLEDLLEDNCDMAEIYKNEYLSDAIEELEIELDKDSNISCDNANDIVEVLEEYA